MATMIRYFLTGFAVLWALWLGALVSGDGNAAHSVRAYLKTDWGKDARQRAKDRELREHNRRANLAAGAPLPEDYRPDWNTGKRN